jgi:HK97 family phage major capsid protein
MGTASYDDVGVWLESILNRRDEYEQHLLELAEAGKLAYSSGAAGHLVTREQVGKSYMIKSWPIAEASLTPTPAEHRNTVYPVKSLYNIEQEQAPPEPEPIEEVIMTEEVKAEVKQEMPDIEALIKQAVADTVKAMQEPQVKAGVQVVEDESDKALRENPFKPNEFFKAVAMWDRGYRDQRLFPLKATGLNEAIPSEGGFLVTPDIANGIYENMWSVGNVLSRFSPITVSGNGLTIRAVDETSRADGSRMGGVRGYWMNEAATKTASKPTFRNIDLKLKKVAALVYATDELLDDTQALEGWITRNVPDELRFQVEASIMNGLGVASPLGILQAGCLISATRTDASEVDAADVSRMWSRRYLGPQDYVWFVNASVMPQLYQMAVSNDPVYVPPGGFSASPYGMLFGRPVIETEYNPYLGTVGDILLASPSQYALITKGGIQSASSIHVKFVEDETAFRFVFRVDGEPIWASAVTAYDGTNTVSPFVALAATT